MDTVSHLIRLAHLEASLDKRCLLGTSTRMDIAAGGEREAPFHVLLEGRCQLQVDSRLLELTAGDVVVIPGGGPHRITTSGRRQAQVSVVETTGDAFTTTRSVDTREPVIDLFCGHYTFGVGAGAMLLRSLPDPVHVSFGQSSESDEMLRMLSLLMRGEAQREGEGTAAILSALCTAVLTMVLRTSRSLTTGATLWTAAGDARIATAITQVLEDPGARWSIDQLSRTAAMSRATFIRHFTQSTGMTIGAFLAQARLMTAAEMLRTTDSNVSTIANKVGYTSESAFARAFRTATGTSPARFRRTLKGDHAAEPPVDAGHLRQRHPDTTGRRRLA